MQDTVLAEGIHFIVETEDEDLRITEGDFTPHDKVIVIQYLVGSLSKLSGIPYNEIMDDLKLVEEPITEAEQVKETGENK